MPTMSNRAVVVQQLLLDKLHGPVLAILPLREKTKGKDRERVCHRERERRERENSVFSLLKGISDGNGISRQFGEGCVVKNGETQSKLSILS